MTEQERERLIDARIHVERIRDADGDWVGADMEWHESVHGLSAADVDEIETEAYRRHLASRQPVTFTTHAATEPITLERLQQSADAMRQAIGAFPDLPEPQATPEQIAELERRVLERNRYPTRAITFPAQMSYVFTPETERMLARLINPATLGERLCRAFLMGDEVALTALVDGIKGGEIEVQP